MFVFCWCRLDLIAAYPELKMLITSKDGPEPAESSWWETQKNPGKRNPFQEWSEKNELSKSWLKKKMDAAVSFQTVKDVSLMVIL